jgi:hypothetical protein
MEDIYIMMSGIAARLYDRLVGSGHPPRNPRIGDGVLFARPYAPRRMDVPDRTGLSKHFHPIGDAYGYLARAGSFFEFLR